MYRAAKRDINEKKIVDFLRRCGYTVLHLDDPGVPDLLVGKLSFNFLLEVKGEKGKLTESQMKFFDTWLGQAAVVRNIGDTKEVLRSIMPIYVYQCKECGNITEIRQHVDDPPLKVCEKCGAEVAKVIQIPGVIYKTEGFTKRVKKEISNE